jgi:hypothetical protein
MNEPKVTDPKKLKRLAAIPIVVGVIALIVGAVAIMRFNERQDRHAREFMAGQRKLEDMDHGPPVGMFFIMGGAIAIAIGMGMIAHANRGKILRKQLRKYVDDPVLREAMHGAASELARNDTQTCSCGTGNALQARFCSHCGRPL